MHKHKETLDVTIKATEKLLSKVGTYDEAIKSLKTIIESGIFEWLK